MADTDHSRADAPRTSIEGLDCRLRPISPGDTSALQRLAASSLPDPWSESLFRSELRRPDSRGWIIEGVDAGGTDLIAFLLLRLGVEVGEILSVAVRANRRRCGLARALVEGAVEESRRAGLRAVQLEVRASNREAAGLYEAAGFVVVGRRPRYYRSGEDALLMTRDIEETRS